MSDYPGRIRIKEEGPREGFQYEKAPIATHHKVELIDALSRVGVTAMQIVSFVNPKAVPGMADAEEVVRLIDVNPDVSYRALWFNEKGLRRAMAKQRLDIKGSLALSASDRFLKANLNRTAPEQHAVLRGMIANYKSMGIVLDRGTIMASFGCNYEGDVAPGRVAAEVRTMLALAAEQDVRLESISLADTMGWATPRSIKRVIDAVRSVAPDAQLELHLHDTRGMAIANAAAGLELGIDRFDASVGGMGGCPFAANDGAAGNICTEDLVFLCDELGIETGIDVEALIECARLAERIIGHALPGSVKTGGTLRRLRAAVAQASTA